MDPCCPSISRLNALFEKCGEKKIGTMTDVSGKLPVRAPELYKLILNSYDRSKVRIHFYSSDGKMNMHIDGGGGDANKYIKLSLMFTDVGFRVSS